jgi:hypothetical protein
MVGPLAIVFSLLKHRVRKRRLGDLDQRNELYGANTLAGNPARFQDRHAISAAPPPLPSVIDSVGNVKSSLSGNRTFPINAVTLNEPLPFHRFNQNRRDLLEGEFNSIAEIKQRLQKLAARFFLLLLDALLHDETHSKLALKHLHFTIRKCD